MRHLAWLNATPDGLKESRLSFFRRQLNKDPDFPQTEGCEHLIEYLLRIGTGKQSGMGLLNIEWSDIDAWKRLTGIPLTGWESETIHTLSCVYVGQFLVSKDKNAQAPYSPQAKKNDSSKSLSEGILKAFESAAKKPTKKVSRRKPSETKAPPRRTKPE